jgi:general secretion pathway protein N
MTRLQRRRLTMALLAVNTALAAAIFLQLRDTVDDGRAQAAAPAAPPVQPADSSGGPAEAPSRIDRLSLVHDVVARPVFSPTRHPDPVVDGTSRPGAALRLTGVILSGSRRLALVHMANEAQPRRVVEGQQIGGYLVDEIRADRIRLRGTDGSREVMLQPAPTTGSETAKEGPHTRPAPLTVPEAPDRKD